MSATFGQLLSTLKKIVQTDENVGTNDKGLIQVNGLSSGYKDTRKFLKTVLSSMYGSAYPPYIGNARSELKNDL